MNLDPVDLFGETIGEPVRRFGLYFLAMVAGGWVGAVALNLDRFNGLPFSWNDFAMGFLAPLAVLFSSAGPLAVAGLVFFLLCPWRLDWPWLLAVAGSSSCLMAQGESETIGWCAWAGLNGGVAGAVWLAAVHRRNRWARGLFELNAENARRNAERAARREAGIGEPGDGGEADGG